MADKMMRVASRKPNGTAAPVSADANGRVIVNRSWQKVWETIDEGMEIRDTSEHDCTAVDLRDVPMFSLRILNRLGVPVTISFKTDVNTLNGYSLANKDAQTMSITVQSTGSYVVITPDDLPELRYLQYLRMVVSASSAPESGAFSAYIVKVV